MTTAALATEGKCAFNKCLKPAAIPLATSETKKFHSKSLFTPIGGLSVFWSIPV
jgi:hypothetical protein